MPGINNVAFLALTKTGSVVNTAPEACIMKLFKAVIYGFRNKLECLSLITRLGWKRSPGTNTIAVNYGCNKFYDTGPWPYPQTLD
jgi:hypothetical protein